VERKGWIVEKVVQHDATTSSQFDELAYARIDFLPIVSLTVGLHILPVELVLLEIGCPRLGLAFPLARLHDLEDGIFHE
jgi:hypothetical protein